MNYCGLKPRNVQGNCLMNFNLCKLKSLFDLFTEYCIIVCLYLHL